MDFPLNNVYFNCLFWIVPQEINSLNPSHELLLLEYTIFFRALTFFNCFIWLYYTRDIYICSCYTRPYDSCLWFNFFDFISCFYMTANSIYLREKNICSWCKLIFQEFTMKFLKMIISLSAFTLFILTEYKGLCKNCRQAKLLRYLFRV